MVSSRLTQEHYVTAAPFIASCHWCFQINFRMFFFIFLGGRKGNPDALHTTVSRFLAPCLVRKPAKPQGEYCEIMAQTQSHFIASTFPRNRSPAEFNFFRMLSLYF